MDRDADRIARLSSGLTQTPTEEALASRVEQRVTKIEIERSVQRTTKMCSMIKEAPTPPQANSVDANHGQASSTYRAGVSPYILQ